MLKIINNEKFLYRLEGKWIIPPWIKVEGTGAASVEWMQHIKKILDIVPNVIWNIFLVESEWVIQAGQLREWIYIFLVMVMRFSKGQGTHWRRVNSFRKSVACEKWPIQLKSYWSTVVIVFIELCCQITIRKYDTI